MNRRYVQALNSLLIPAAPQLLGNEDAVAARQRTMLSSQCIAVLLSALQTAESACRESNGMSAPQCVPVLVYEHVQQRGGTPGAQGWGRCGVKDIALQACLT